MCAYCIREAGLGRVVYALGSPVMGGLSKWNILRDEGVSDQIPQVFGPVPEVVSGVLSREVQDVWRQWNAFAWEMIKLRGLLTECCADEGRVQLQPARGLSLWHHLSILFARVLRPKIKTGEPE
jgi:tRNA(adenine34) deaminase